MPGLALLVTVMALTAGTQGPVAEARKMFDEGNAFFEKAENDKALASYDRALALDRTQAEFHYHLALALYIQGDYQKAAAEYENCLPNARTQENTIGCSAWQYVALVRAGRPDDARAILDRASPDLKLQSGAAYLDRLLLFKGAKTEEEVAKGMDVDNLQLPTVAYGVGVWHLLNGRQARAREYFEKAVAPPAQQSAFGAVAAYYELQRMKK